MQEYLNSLSISTRVSAIIAKLRIETAELVQPMSFSIVSLYGRDPFLILVSCLLSSRTTDYQALPASLRLFSLAQTPDSLVFLDLLQIEKSIYPVGFYRQKAKHLRGLCQKLIAEYGGSVPCSFDRLITLPGVGPKTANLVLGVGFGIPALCVDTHVHRICNRLGLVVTKTPLQTEVELKKIVPPENWIELNRLLVMWGQTICRPISPLCSQCPLKKICPRKGVGTSR